MRHVRDEVTAHLDALSLLGDVFDDDHDTDRDTVGDDFRPLEVEHLPRRAEEIERSLGLALHRRPRRDFLERCIDQGALVPRASERECRRVVEDLGPRPVVEHQTERQGLDCQHDPLVGLVGPFSGFGVFRAVVGGAAKAEREADSTCEPSSDHQPDDQHDDGQPFGSVAGSAASDDEASDSVARGSVAWTRCWVRSDPLSSGNQPVTM